MSRTLVIGDIHGGAKALEQVWDRAGVDPANDRVICLGDVCDGWPETPEAFEKLFEARDLIYILGNHDYWTLRWMHGTLDPLDENAWYVQGGKNTLSAYRRRKELVDPHMQFLEQEARLYYRDEQDRIFVHGGFDHTHPVEDQPDHTLYFWDRSLVKLAMDEPGRADELLAPYRAIFVGHTQTVLWDSTEPIHRGKLWMLDTGAVSRGPVTIMDVDTKECWQSEPAYTFYPDTVPRGG